MKFFFCEIQHRISSVCSVSTSIGHFLIYTDCPNADTSSSTSSSAPARRARSTSGVGCVCQTTKAGKDDHRKQISTTPENKLGNPINVSPRSREVFEQIHSPSANADFEQAHWVTVWRQRAVRLRFPCARGVEASTARGGKHNLTPPRTPLTTG